MTDSQEKSELNSAARNIARIQARMDAKAQGMTPEALKEMWATEKKARTKSAKKMLRKMSKKGFSLQAST